MTEKLIATFRERYQAHQERHGSASCPIEDGSIANLADNECPHGFLPTDKKRDCECFGKGKR